MKSISDTILLALKTGVPLRQVRLYKGCQVKPIKDTKHFTYMNV